MPADVVSWWMFLCAVAVLNVTAWSLAARALQRHRLAVSVEWYAVSRIQLILSGAYVFGCAFRSVLPVYDIPRLCLFDTWLSDVAVGRSVATFAELSFAGQWALMLYTTARFTKSGAARIVSLLLLPLIATAEVCSWYAVLTTNNLGHVAENSLWGVSAALVLGVIALNIPRFPAVRRRMLIAWCAAGVLYVAYMFLVDVPMYWSRWLADQARGRHYLSVAQGLIDVAHRRMVSYRWDDWKSEVVWMSLYFSVAVWISISLISARASTARSADDKGGQVSRPDRFSLEGEAGG